MTTDEFTPEYRTLLSAVTDQGEKDKQADQSPLRDDDLWKAALFLGPDAHLPADMRDDMLADLRDAYDEGYQPDLLDVGRAVAELARLGHTTEVVHTSGDCWTVYAGEKRISRSGEERWSVSAGQCFYRDRDTYLTGHVDEFTAGPHDDTSATLKFEPGTTAKTIARRIAQIIELVENKRKQLAESIARVDDVAQRAEDAMWEYVAKAFPECPTRDFDPRASHTVSTMVRGAVDLWVRTNFNHTLNTLSVVEHTRTQVVPFSYSQRPIRGGQPALIHDGQDWPDTFKRLLITLVDERIADPEPEPFFPAVVYHGTPADGYCTKVTGLIVRREGLWLVFDDGFRVHAESVLSIHIN